MPDVFCYHTVLCTEDGFESINQRGRHSSTERYIHCMFRFGPAAAGNLHRRQVKSQRPCIAPSVEEEGGDVCIFLLLHTECAARNILCRIVLSLGLPIWLSGIRRIGTYNGDDSASTSKLHPLNLLNAHFTVSNQAHHASCLT